MWVTVSWLQDEVLDHGKDIIYFNNCLKEIATLFPCLMSTLIITIVFFSFSIHCLMFFVLESRKKRKMILLSMNACMMMILVVHVGKRWLNVSIECSSQYSPWSVSNVHCKNHVYINCLLKFNGDVQKIFIIV